ncbi:MAG: cobalt-precorrin-5B (C(1))-methyltransferase, partial [Proteobacteria bacterium]|nr:cobalt-precorrin-5B (C(1))-methyltransferase [Pseudomonadota bacterium]
MSRRKPKGPLRKGWTTGACATAAAQAAYRALLTGDFPDPVTITLPRGERPSFPLSRASLEDGRATAGVIKDAGDDPDVTDGAEIISTVESGPPGSGVTFAAGEGVGTVTLAGLPVAVGEAAINPVPRRMMTGAVNALAREFGCAPVDVCITVSIPGGEELALRTTNGRLGIKGGLSVLGTTGVVIPYSCASWIHSIHSGIDVARAMGSTHVAGCTGSTSERAVQKLYGLPDEAMLDMGDFVGGLLKYLRRHPVPRLTLGGGFAKISKLAMGHLDLHSGRS